MTTKIWDKVVIEKRLPLILLMSCFMAVFMGLAPSQAHPPARAKSVRNARFKIVAYVPQYRVMSLNPDIAANVTDLIFFSVSPTPDGEIDSGFLTPAMETKLAQIKNARHIRLWLSIGGGDRSSAFPQMATDPVRRARFVAVLTQFLLQHGFDGADFDWEFPNNPAEAAAFTSLIVDTKRALAPRGLKVSVAVAPGSWFDPKMLAAADQFNLMTYYDRAHHSGLANCQQDVDYLIKNGADPKKICLGIPFYAEDTTNGSDNLIYRDLAAQYHPDAAADEVGGYAFNGVKTVQDKTQYALDRGLGGVMIFELGQDTNDGILSHAIHQLVYPSMTLLTADPDGSYELTADNAEILGDSARVELSGGIPDIGYWDSMNDSGNWQIDVPAGQAGQYAVSMECGCDPNYAGSTYTVTFDSGTRACKRQTLTGTVTPTSNWDTFHTIAFPGTITLTAPSAMIRMQALALTSGDLINLRRIVLTKVAQTPQLQGNTETGETPAQFAKRTQWWRDAKFGLFIHWGVYSVPNSNHANTWGLGEWYQANTGMSVADYEKFALQFDPVKFDAKSWVAMAKAAGMKYLVITAKHHDGFDMFDSKLSDYNIVKATPWHHDPMKDLARECRRQGIKLCFYYSVKDWHNYDYLPRIPTDHRPTTGASLDRYMEYLKGQVRELLTNYGPVGVIWFDGHLDHTADEEHATEVVKMMRSIQPNLMINDRINLAEDFSTPEQVIPDNGLGVGRLWETCMTINGHWGYAWSDHNVKSKPFLVQTLCDVVSKGGNYLLNVGPDASGVIPDEEVSRLKDVGAWMDTNGESIYGTTRSPFRKLDFDGRCTQKGNTLYLQVFNWPQNGLTVHGLVTPVKNAVALLGNERLTTSTLADGGFEISKPDHLDPAATVVRLRLAGPLVIDPAAVRLNAEEDGSYLLTANNAGIEGDTARLEQTPDGTWDIGYWTSMNDSATWKINVPATEAGEYSISMECGCDPKYAGSTYTVTIDSGTKQTLTATVTPTANWDTFQTISFPNTITLAAPAATIRMQALALTSGDLINLRKIVLTRVR